MQCKKKYIRMIKKKKNQTRELVKPPVDKEVRRVKWVYNPKLKLDGSI